MERLITEQSILDYRDHMLRRERSRGTVENYLRGVRGFAAWLGGAPVGERSAGEWKRALLRRGCRPRTVNAKLAAVHSFFHFMGWRGLETRALKIQRRLFREDSRELTREEYQRLLSAARSGGNDRLALVMEAICATGIRVSEVRYLTVEAARRGRAEVYLKGKIRTILIPNKLCRKLLHYAKGKKITSGEIFLTRGRKPLSRKQIWAELKRLCQRAGVAPSKVFPHNLRHLFARCFYRATRDMAQLADVLGHASVDTTRIYLISTGAEHARVLDRLQLML